MQRYMDGEKIPRYIIELFTGKTTDGFGEVACTLRYAPKFGHILLSPIWDNTFNECYSVDWAAAANILTLYVFIPRYYKADTPTGTAAAIHNAGGNDPHSHTIASTLTDPQFRAVTAQALAGFAVHYAVG